MVNSIYRLLSPKGATTVLFAFGFFSFGFISNGFYRNYPTDQQYSVSNDVTQQRQPFNAVSDVMTHHVNGSNVTLVNTPIGYINKDVRQSQESYEKNRYVGPKLSQVLGHARNFTRESDIDAKVKSSLPPVTPLDLNSIRGPVSDLYYIKVHKTGSTTLQNIIYRYGFERNLTFALFNCDNAMPFPNPPHFRYLIPTEMRSFNILADHAFFDPSVFHLYMSNDTKVISQLRHPMKFLTSSFGFQNLEKSYQLLRDKDPISTFLKSPRLFDKRAAWKGSSIRTCGPLRSPSFTKNAMAFHMGYEQQFNDDPQFIKAFITSVDKQIDHVLILEKFDESLIILKRLFKWETRDVIYLPLWSLSFHGRKNFYRKRTFDQSYELEQLHKKWAPADYAIYDFYTQKLDATLALQKADFWDEVEDLKDTVSKMKTFCQQMCVITGKQRMATKTRDEAYDILNGRNYTFYANKFHEEFNVTYLDCVKMVLATMEYHAASKARQIPALCDKSNNLVRSKFRVKMDSKYCNKKDRILYTFPWAFIKTKLFTSQFQCIKYVNG